ncbi:MAG TPA: DUF2188 domain-containing protein [Planctomycetota bacterium]|nr:DUF2188 domain-containing protein [Planctomycetota bacterium]
MAKRIVYHVSPSERGWEIQKEGASRASNIVASKSSAIARAKELATRGSLGQVKIHTQNGRVESERTYGDDPRRTKG